MEFAVFAVMRWLNSKRSAGQALFSHEQFQNAALHA